MKRGRCCCDRRPLPAALSVTLLAVAEVGRALDPTRRCCTPTTRLCCAAARCSDDCVYGRPVSARGAPGRLVAWRRGSAAAGRRRRASLRSRRRSRRVAADVVLRCSSRAEARARDGACLSDAADGPSRAGAGAAASRSCRGRRARGSPDEVDELRGEQRRRTSGRGADDAPSSSRRRVPRRQFECLVARGAPAADAVARAADPAGVTRAALSSPPRCGYGARRARSRWSGLPGGGGVSDLVDPRGDAGRRRRRPHRGRQARPAAESLQRAPSAAGHP